MLEVQSLALGRQTPKKFHQIFFEKFNWRSIKKTLFEPFTPLPLGASRYYARITVVPSFTSYGSFLRWRLFPRTTWKFILYCNTSFYVIALLYFFSLGTKFSRRQQGVLSIWPATHYSRVRWNDEKQSCMGAGALETAPCLSLGDWSSEASECTAPSQKAIQNFAYQSFELGDVAPETVYIPLIAVTAPSRITHSSNLNYVECVIAIKLVPPFLSMGLQKILLMVAICP